MKGVVDMRTWILFSASILAIAIRPEINSVEIMGRNVAVVWIALLIAGFFFDAREHIKRTE
jgi:hypothetical protein